ncbi:unnamed protein product [Absidia cylindrospora]
MSSFPVKIEVFTDFDGTLCYDDTGVLLVDDPRCMGRDKRKKCGFVTLTLDEAWSDHLDYARVDPGFPAFHEYCCENKIPITVVSSGLYPLLQKMMIKFLGEDAAKEIELISNDVAIDGRKWDIQWHDDSSYGNDKSKALAKARNAASSDTIFVFCGDGVSDISAAKHADVLFARKGRDLETHCERNGIPFITFDSFSDILHVVDRLVDRKSRLEKDATTGFCRVVDF